LSRASGFAAGFADAGVLAVAEVLGVGAANFSSGHWMIVEEGVPNPGNPVITIRTLQSLEISVRVTGSCSLWRLSRTDSDFFARHMKTAGH
jgi:hypothetical protein